MEKTSTPIYELNNNCIKIISKFGRVIKKLDNTIILLQDKNVLQKIAYHTNRTSDPELQKLYLLLLKEIDLPRDAHQRKLLESSSLTIKSIDGFSAAA